MLTGFYPALEAKEAQTIKVSRISKKKYGDDPFVVTAKASSKLPVSIFVNGPASIDKKGKITIKGAGKVRVFAIQMGDDRYASAKPKIVTVDIAKAPLIVRAEDKKMKEGEKEKGKRQNGETKGERKDEKGKGP